jgi:hypothetical protein
MHSMYLREDVETGLGADPGCWRVRVIGGPDTGAHWPLPAGRALDVGRDLIDDPTVSAAHVTIGDSWETTPSHGPSPADQ